MGEPAADDNPAVALHDANIHRTVGGAFEGCVRTSIGIEPSNVSNGMAPKRRDKTGHKNPTVRLHNEGMEAVTGRAGVKRSIESPVAMQARNRCARSACDLVEVAAHEHLAVALQSEGFEFGDRRGLEALVQAS